MIRAVYATLFWLALAVHPLGAQEFRALARVNAEDSALQNASSDRAQMRLALSQAVPFRVFTVSDPARVVLDFREVAWDALPAAFNQSRAVARVSTGSAPDQGWSRMVLKLATPMAVESAAMQTDPETREAVIELSLSPISLEEFTAQARPPVGLSVPVEPVADAPARPREQVEERLLIVLDPGHGGVDPGAQRSGYDESDLVLVFARELREALLRTGMFEVMLTRDADIFIPLPTRVTMARAAGAHAFLSIHADALAQGNASGATVYTLSETATDEASAALAEHHDRADILAGVDLAGSDDEVTNVLLDLARLETDPRSDMLADALVEGIASAQGALHSRPRLEAGFTVLSAADIPSVLLEIGYMSDEGDLGNILDAEWRARIQGGLVQALMDWARADAMQAVLLRQ